MIDITCFNLFKPIGRIYHYVIISYIHSAVRHYYVVVLTKCFLFMPRSLEKRVHSFSNPQKARKTNYILHLDRTVVHVGLHG